MPKISEIIHLAADKYLSSFPYYHSYIQKPYFSCCAIDDAIDELIPRSAFNHNNRDMYNRIMDGVEELGLSIGSCEAFDDISEADRQAARY